MAGGAEVVADAAGSAGQLKGAYRRICEGLWGNGRVRHGSTAALISPDESGASFSPEIASTKRTGNHPQRQRTAAREALIHVFLAHDDLIDGLGNR